MGTRIEAVSTARPRWFLRRHALGLEDAAARACLERGGRAAQDIDLLINVGVYRENNTVEPALASLIQEDIGANPGAPHVDGHGTFSFDVNNGGAGALSAAYLIDGFVSAGTAHVGLVVAGDADPCPRTSREFPFLPAGGAILLGHTDDEEGFHRFEFRTFPALSKVFEACVEWEPERGCNGVHVREDPALREACVESAKETTIGFLDAVRLKAGEVDVLVTSQYPSGFVERLAREIGVRADRIPAVQPDLQRAHTAGPIAALESAVGSGSFARARNVLFVAAAPGLTVAVALYKRASGRGVVVVRSAAGSWGSLWTDSCPDSIIEASRSPSMSCSVRMAARLMASSCLRPLRRSPSARQQRRRTRPSGSGQAPPGRGAPRR